MSRRGAVRTVGISALAGGLALHASVASAQPSQQPVPWPVGVWRCSAASRPNLNRQDIHSLDVFLPGGIYLRFDSPVERTANLSDIPDAVEYTGPFAGQWVELPNGELRATSVQLNYDRTGVLWSEERLQLSLTYDAASGAISGTYEWRETAPDGATILEAVGLPYQGVRVAVEA